MLSLHIARCNFLGIDISLLLEFTVWCVSSWCIYYVLLIVQSVIVICIFFYCVKKYVDSCGSRVW